MSFTFTLNGKNYNSELSGEKVAEELRSFDSGFAQSLVSSRQQYGRWTERQAMWAHKLVIDKMDAAKQDQNRQQQEVVITVPQTLEFLKRPVKLKRIKLTFQHNDGPVTIKKASTEAKGFWIAKNGQLCGQILPNGTLVNKGMSPDVLCLMDELEENAAGTVAKHGKESGQCCFCSLPLTDERSTEKGYGPICAGHYNLPWGE